MTSQLFGGRQEQTERIDDSGAQPGWSSSGARSIKPGLHLSVRFALLQKLFAFYLFILFIYLFFYAHVTEERKQAGIKLPEGNVSAVVKSSRCVGLVLSALFFFFFKKLYLLFLH